MCDKQFHNAIATEGNHNAITTNKRRRSIFVAKSCSSSSGLLSKRQSSIERLEIRSSKSPVIFAIKEHKSHIAQEICTQNIVQ